MAPLASQQHPKSDPASTRVSRSKTVFQIAQPPPSKKSRKLRRPRILLQLRQLSENKRPLPVLDVRPSAYFAPPLAQRFPKIFRGKKSLGPNDIIVTNSDSAGSVPRSGEDAGESSGDEACDSREVVGTICRQVRKPQDNKTTSSAEICLDQGLAWKVTLLPRGGYEFNATGADGSLLQARWVRRDRPHRRTSSLPDATYAGPKAVKRFTFSIINPSARQHPVIASMTAESIEVHDQYPASVPQTTPPEAPTSPTSTLSSETTYFDIENLRTPPMQPLIHTDHHLRSLVVITGIYVSLEEGWAQDTLRNQRQTQEQEMDSTTGVESKPTGAKVGRASTQIFHRRPAALPDELRSPKTSRTWDGANSTGSDYTDSINRRSLSSPLRRSKQHHQATPFDEGANGHSNDSSRPSSQGLPTYSENGDSGTFRRAGVKQAVEKSQRALANDHADKDSTGRSTSTKSSTTSELKGRSARSLTGFRRFFSLPCLGGAPASEAR